MYTSDFFEQFTNIYTYIHTYMGFKCPPRKKWVKPIWGMLANSLYVYTCNLIDISQVNKPVYIQHINMFDCLEKLSSTLMKEGKFLK